MLNRFPKRVRLRTKAITSFMSYGISGISITSPPPAIPDSNASHPALRPITSTSITRWCDWAVVCSWSMARLAVFRAESNPKVMSVSIMSLSMVLGTPTILAPFLASPPAMDMVPSPPTQISASNAKSSYNSMQLSDTSTFWTLSLMVWICANGFALLLVPRIVPPWVKIPEAIS